MMNYQKSSRLLRILAFTVLGLLACNLTADTENETRILAQIIKELESLETLLVRAELARNPNKRLRFRYDWLRSDLDKVQRGIQDYINGIQPETSVHPASGR